MTNCHEFQKTIYMKAKTRLFFINATILTYMYMYKPLQKPKITWLAYWTHKYSECLLEEMNVNKNTSFLFSNRMCGCWVSLCPITQGWYTIVELRDCASPCRNTSPVLSKHPEPSVRTAIHSACHSYWRKYLYVFFSWYKVSF